MTKRFEAYHWQVQRVADGNDLHAIEDAIEAARRRREADADPGAYGDWYGSPKAGTNKVHGEALGADAMKATKKILRAGPRTRASTCPKRR